VPIGGRVVDADGNLITGAHVSFSNRPDVAAESRPESRNFGSPFYIETVTGADGSWRIDRIAEEAIRSIGGAASHPEHVRSDVDVARNPEAAKDLLGLTYTFRLGRSVIVRGIVVDPEGQPVSNADVLVGFRDGAYSRKAISGPDGAFGVAGCKPGKSLLTAEAEGFTATTIAVELSGNAGPFQVQLQRGKILRLRVVNKNDEPIPNAGVWLDTINVTSGLDGPQPKPVQIEFNRKTAADGRLVWDSAPDADLLFGISASGYMRVDRVKLHPDEEEHVVTLPPAVTIAGTVRDDLTDELIPKFRIITGWPGKQFVNGVTTNVAQWSTIDRFWMNFSGGEYRHSFEEPVVGGVADPSYIFKFEAEGYAPFVSRTVRADEGEVRLDGELACLHLPPHHFSPTTRGNCQQPASTVRVATNTRIPSLGCPCASLRAYRGRDWPLERRRPRTGQLRLDRQCRYAPCGWARFQSRARPRDGDGSRQLFLPDTRSWRNCAATGAMKNEALDFQRMCLATASGCSGSHRMCLAPPP